MNNTKPLRKRILSNFRTALSIVITFALIELIIIAVQFNLRLEQADISSNYHLRSIELLSNLTSLVGEIRYQMKSSEIANEGQLTELQRRQVTREIFLISEAFDELILIENSYGKGSLDNSIVELSSKLEPLLVLLNLDTEIRDYETNIDEGKLDVLNNKILQIKRLHANLNADLLTEADRTANLSLYFILLIGLFAVIASYFMIRRLLGSINESLLLQETYGQELAEERDALHKQETENHELLNFVIEGIITINEHGLILSFNRAAEKMFGYASEEVTGKNVSILMPEKEANNHDDYIQNYTVTGVRKIIGNPRQLEGQHKNKEKFPMLLTVVELPTADDQPRRFIGSCQDLSIVMAQEEQIRRTQKMDALGKLTGGIAHDYNNMLAVISGYSSLLSHKFGADDDIAKYAEEINKACMRGTKLTNKLLSFSKPISREVEPVNLNESLRQMQDMLTKTITARIELRFNLQSKLSLVDISASDFEDAILNMCINAMHAISGHGLIDITTRTITKKYSDYVEVSITDDGIGMDKKMLDKIFDPFFSTKGDKGTGLGLSQVYNFVQHYKGSIEVNSKPNEGTQFKLLFPVSQSSRISQETITTNTPEDGNYSGNILVVDDEPQLVEYLSSLLQLKGFTTFEATNATQALEILEQQSVDIMISDVVMPEVNGLQLSSRVLELYPEVKIQLVSGYADRVDSNEVPLDIMNALITKPYDESVLINRLVSLLDEIKTG